MFRKKTREDMMQEPFFGPLMLLWTIGTAVLVQSMNACLLTSLERELEWPRCELLSLLLGALLIGFTGIGMRSYVLGVARARSSLGWE